MRESNASLGLPLKLLNTCCSTRVYMCVTFSVDGSQGTCPCELVYQLILVLKLGWTDTFVTIVPSGMSEHSYHTGRLLSKILFFLSPSLISLEGLVN